MEIIPATPDRFEMTYPLLQLFGNPRMSRDDWRKMLFDLPWPVDEPHRGYLMLDGGEPVGFMGTVFSKRVIGGVTHRFCATSSWIVKESHRFVGLALVKPVIDLRAHTIVNLTPSPAASRVFRRMGLTLLEDSQYLVPPLPTPAEVVRDHGASVTTDLDAMRRELDPAVREMVDHFAPTLAAQAMIRRGARRCHLVATRTSWKGRWRLAHIVYASDWPLFWDHVARVSLALSRAFGTVGLRVDARHAPARPPRFARRRSLEPARLWRPADPRLEPSMIDEVYTELVGQRF